MKNKTFNGSELFPNNSFVNDKNNISINGVDLKDLAEEYGTPLYVYDEETIIGTIIGVIFALWITIQVIVLFEKNAALPKSTKPITDEEKDLVNRHLEANIGGIKNE